jgi:HAD superfamily hydrolase (TIGR01549 family)
MVKNLIFDLGGVILDLAVPQTLIGFSKLSGLSAEEVTDLFRSSEGFLDFEKGAIGEAEFRDFVRNLYHIKASDEQLDECWNAMLLTIPYEKLELLRKLKSSHRTFLLSNTNTIHLDFINQKVLPGMNGISSLDDYFHQTYYSHLMGKRKPDPEIFLQVLQENNLDPAETLFLDDNKDNVAGAQKVGLQTAYVDPPGFILQYFS